MKSSRYSLMLTIFLFAGLLAGCSQPQVKDANLISLNHQAADQLIRATAAELSASYPILITSFANIDDLKSSSTFGRIAGEQVGSKFSQNGYSVVEMKLRDNVLIKEKTGEFILSREMKSLIILHDAQAILVGTYAVGATAVYVTVKLIKATNNIVMSSYDYALPLGPDTKYLLKKGR